MKNQLIELHEPGKTFGTFYLVEMPSRGEPDFYRQAVSFQAFCTRELNRAFPKEPLNRDWVAYAQTVKYCSTHTPRPGESMASFLTRLGEDPNAVTVIACQGVWDFYEKIGYDRVAKRYL